MNFEQLQDRIGYRFGDRSLLLQSLTHTSYGHENLQNKTIAFRDNERLEFLGDAVLDLVISDILLETFPNWNEGNLSKMRAAIVNEKTLGEIALKIRLDECVRLGKGESQTGGNKKPSILSSSFEALVAAIYLDGGFHGIYPVVRNLFSSFFGSSSQDLVNFYDHKTQLQEIMQAKWKVTPTYVLKNSEGPDHAKKFVIEVCARGETLACAMGSSKKEAEQNAAREAIQQLSSQITV